MSDAIFAMKFAWEGNTVRRNFYRITDLGVERLVSLTDRTSSPPSVEPPETEVRPFLDSQKIS
jgi:hypothetical protein